MEASNSHKNGLFPEDLFQLHHSSWAMWNTPSLSFSLRTPNHTESAVLVRDHSLSQISSSSSKTERMFTFKACPMSCDSEEDKLTVSTDG